MSTSFGLFLSTCLAASVFGATGAQETSPAVGAIQALGLDLLGAGARSNEWQNALLSPYSIQSAMILAYEGADGLTREEMQRVLHYPGEVEWEAFRSNWVALGQSLQKSQVHLATLTEAAGRSKDAQSPTNALVFQTANRLFGQKDYPFKSSYLKTLEEIYQTPLENADFIHHSELARQQVNHWVEGQTMNRIQELIPANGVDSDSRLVLVNAVFFKEPWSQPFKKSATQVQPFFSLAGQSQDVPTMSQTSSFGYLKGEGFSAVSLPYVGNEFQLLILLPDERDGLPALETRVAKSDWKLPRTLPRRELVLSLPKWRFEPPTLRLAEAFQKLGMKSAFDIPMGSARFDRMAPRLPNDYLKISDVFHKTFWSLDEQGTEAAAATAVVVARATSVMPNPAEPLIVKVDHPFLFVLQHRSTGAWIFLGRMVNPALAF